jgi:hypothetical protein
MEVQGDETSKPPADSECLAGLDADEPRSGGCGFAKPVGVADGDLKSGLVEVFGLGPVPRDGVRQGQQDGAVLSHERVDIQARHSAGGLMRQRGWFGHGFHPACQEVWRSETGDSGRFDSKGPRQHTPAGEGRVSTPPFMVGNWWR